MILGNGADQALG